MTRIYATARKTMTIDIVGQSVIIRPTRGRATTRTFRNRYTLRKFVNATQADATRAGFVSVNR